MLVASCWCRAMGWLSWRPWGSSAPVSGGQNGQVGDGKEGRGGGSGSPGDDRDTDAALLVEAKIQRMFKALARKTRRTDMLRIAAASSASPLSSSTGTPEFGSRQPVIEREDALEALELILGLENQPDSTAMLKLCPGSWEAERLTYEQFRDLVHVAGAWSALRYVCHQPDESSFTYLFPLLFALCFSSSSSHSSLFSKLTPDPLLSLTGIKMKK